MENVATDPSDGEPISALSSSTRSSDAPSRRGRRATRTVDDAPRQRCWPSEAIRQETLRSAAYAYCHGRGLKIATIRGLVHAQMDHGPAIITTVDEWKKAVAAIPNEPAPLAHDRRLDGAEALQLLVGHVAWDEDALVVAEGLGRVVYSNAEGSIFLAVSPGAEIYLVRAARTRTGRGVRVQIVGRMIEGVVYASRTVFDDEGNLVPAFDGEPAGAAIESENDDCDDAAEE